MNYSFADDYVMTGLAIWLCKLQDVIADHDSDDGEAVGLAMAADAAEAEAKELATKHLSVI